MKESIREDTQYNFDLENYQFIVINVITMM